MYKKAKLQDFLKKYNIGSNAKLDQVPKGTLGEIIIVP
jgi:hypothetical protein